ncbi:MAG: hypothetical protein KI786_17620 [Mameliella sp.]|nr:hypothetical protein [Phaeodactylibacter sp.]
MSLILKRTALYFRFRLRQLGRLLYSAGWPGVFAVPLLFVFGLQGLDTLANAPEWALVVIIFGLIFSWHIKRKDLPFLRLAGYPVRKLIGLEYAIVGSLTALPVVWYNSGWETMIGVIVVGFACGFLPKRNSGQHQRFTAPVAFLPKVLFEWRAAMRRYGWILILLWLISFAAFYGMAVLLVVMLIWASFVPTVFEYQEPRELQIAVIITGGGLFRHWLRHFLFQVIIFLPGMLIHLLFYPEYWYMPLAGLGFISLMLTFSMLYKYATWQPGKQRIGQGMPLTLAYISLFFPPLIPVVLFYIVKYGKGACNQIKLMFNAANS